MKRSILPNILIVDDSSDLREALSLYLRQNGFRTRVAANAVIARQVVERTTIHLAMVDIMMPGEDGLSLCQYLVSERRLPVILLTAKVGDDDRVVGLDIGADDYISKPFNPRELLARINAVLRRVPPSQPAQIGNGRKRFGTLIHDPARSRVVQEDATEIVLTTGENLLLGALLDHAGEAMSRAQLLDLIRGREMRSYDRAVDNTISRLRQKLKSDSLPDGLIVTEWGRGYRISVPVKDLGA